MNADIYPAISCQFCHRQREGAHYNIWKISTGGVVGLRQLFRDAKAKRPPMSEAQAVKAQKITKDQLRRLRKAHDDISDVQIELLRNRDAGKGEIDWQTLFQLRGELNRWLYSGEGSRFEMSEAQVKATPSKAAMELAEALFPDFTPGIHVGYADIIDSHVRDLLEKAQTLNVYIEARWGDSDATIQGLNRPLSSALEPWKPK